MSESFLAASSSSIGGRQSQEDRVVAIHDLNEHIPEGNRAQLDPSRSFFAVFDGHGGHACSDFLAKSFHVELARSPLLRSDPKAALLEVWRSLDGEFYKICEATSRSAACRTATAAARNVDDERQSSVGDGARVERSGGDTVVPRPSSTAIFPRDGSTATVLLIVGNKLFAANCGDSAGVLTKKDGGVEMLTKDHGTVNPSEIARIERLGGFFREQTIKTTKSWPFCCVKRDTVVGKPRVYPGGLLVTRSFGDFSAKVVSLGGKPGVILPDCEEIVEMTVGADWSDLVIASDGVWDVVSPNEIRQLLARLDAGEAASSWASSAAEATTTISDLRGNEKKGGKDRRQGGDETTRLKHAQLKATCAKLVLSCIRHSYWGEHRAVADNASVVILRFLTPEVPREASEEHASGRRSGEPSTAVI